MPVDLTKPLLLQSVAFKKAFLRMDGNNPQGKDEDFEIAYSQIDAGSCEYFFLVNMPEMPTDKIWKIL